MRLNAINTKQKIKTMLKYLEKLPLKTDPAKTVVAVVACPLGNEYPVALAKASLTGCILESSIHGRYMHAVIFTNPLTKSAAPSETNRY